MLEPDQPGARAAFGDDAKKTRKQTNSSRAKKKKSQGDAAPDDLDKKKVRATREDKGIPRLEERDLIVLRWVLQMYAVRFDQLQVLLARHSPKKEDLF